MKPPVLGLFLILCIITHDPIRSQNIPIKGIVYDEKFNEPLPGASVLIEGTSIGMITDEDGKFLFESEINPPFNIQVSYTGFQQQLVTIHALDSAIAIYLSSGMNFDKEIIVSASRKREKIMEAPASVSVIGPEKLERQAETNAMNALKYTAGVQITQQSAERYNIEVRGSNDLFSTETFVIMDYRSLIGPGTGTFDPSNSPLNMLDLEKIEVVRGPGSALYGPGVTSGIVHFMTKDPFRHPGTNLEIIGGQWNTFKASLRHAWHHPNQKWGYKINATWKRGDEFSTINDDSLSNFRISEQITDPITGDSIFHTNGSLQDNYYGFGINGSIEFRPTEKMSIVATSGINRFSGLFWNSQGEGLNQATDYFSQVRFSTGNFFAQFYTNYNDGGTREMPTFLYRSGQRTVIDRFHLEGQLQYYFQIPALRTSVVTGGDWRSLRSDSQGTVYGRNEPDDAFNILGGYAQIQTQINSFFDLVLATRVDGFSSIQTTAFSPRVALVFKPSPQSSFRAVFNKANAPNNVLTINSDLKLADNGSYDIWLYGNRTAQTFPGQPQTLSIYEGIGNFSGLDMPLNLAYQAALDILIKNPEFVEAIAPILPELRQLDLSAAGMTKGVPIDINTNMLLPLNGSPASQLRDDISFELGYQGLINDKWSVFADVYHITRKNFVALRPVSPLMIYPELPGDLENATFNALSTLAPAETAEVLAAIFGQAGTVIAFDSKGDPAPLGLIETEQMPDDDRPQLAFGYQSYGKISYWGIDIGIEYFLASDWSVFSNISWISDNLFDGPKPEDTQGYDQTYPLNIPTFKLRTGVNYNAPERWNGNLFFSYDAPFESRLGLYSGTVKARFVLDTNLGYSWSKGIYTGITAGNILDNRHQSFPGMPEVRRRVLGKIIYKF